MRNLIIIFILGACLSCTKLDSGAGESLSTPTSDITNLQVTVNSEVSVTVSWAPVTELSSPTYIVAYVTGTTPPADCTIGTVVSNIVSPTKQLTVSFDQAYAFRVCADDGTTITTGQTTTATTPSVQRIFNTADNYSANLGGLVGADGICQGLANFYGLGGTWKAILSDSNVNAVDRILITKPIYNYRPSGSGGPQRVADNSTDFWDGTLDNAIRYDGDGTTTGTTTWTGSDSAGIGSGGNFCMDWFDNSTGISVIGIGITGGVGWMNGSVMGCPNANGLYCINGQ